MELCLIRNEEELKQFQPNEGKCPVIVTENFLFAGPMTAGARNCLRCFWKSLQFHKSYYYQVINGGMSGNRAFQLTNSEKQIIDSLPSLERRVVVLKRENLATEEYPVYCLDEICSENEAASAIEMPNLDYMMSLEKREKDGEAVFDKKVKDALLNPHTGVGLRVFRDPNASVIPMFYVKSNIWNSEYYSYGRAFNCRNAKQSALFEMIERYSSIVPHRRGAVQGSYSSLQAKGFHILNPEKLHLNQLSERAKDLYGFEEFSTEKKYFWTEAINLVDGEKVLLPEQAVYYDNQLIHNEKRFLYETSNGTAMGGSYEEAVVYALLEAAERDAFLLNWYNNISPIHLDCSKVKNRRLVNIIRYMECIGYRMHVMNITTDLGIPVIWVAAENVSNKDALMKCYNAAGAHFNPEKALEAALVEVVTSIGVYEKIIAGGGQDERLRVLKNRPEAVMQMEDHVYFYALEDNFRFISTYYTNEKCVDFKECFADWYEQNEHFLKLGELIEQLSSKVQDMYVSVLSNNLTDNLGIWCVKAVVPGMLTMTFGVDNQRINLERIQKGAVSAGYRTTEIRAEEINLLPHPFP